MPAWRASASTAVTHPCQTIQRRPPGPAQTRRRAGSTRFPPSRLRRSRGSSPPARRGGCIAWDTRATTATFWAPRTLSRGTAPPSPWRLSAAACQGCCGCGEEPAGHVPSGSEPCFERGCAGREAAVLPGGLPRQHVEMDVLQIFQSYHANHSWRSVCIGAGERAVSAGRCVDEQALVAGVHPWPRTGSPPLPTCARSCQVVL